MTARLKHLARLVTTCEASDARPYLALEHLDPGTGKLVPDAQLEEREAPQVGATAVESGDVLFGKLRPYLAKVCLADQPAYASTELLCLRPREGTEPRWLRYLCMARPLLAWAVATSEGTKMPRTSWESLGQFPVDLPDPVSQRRIADFLDIETARIDALIEKKQHVRDLLALRRTSVVRDGVEGRFTTSGDGRETGVPWMSERPAPWREARLTLVARLGSGHTPSRDHPEWWEDCSIPWITTGEVAQMRSDRIEFISDTREMISQLGLANSSARLHPAGTVVLCRTASAGYSAIMGRDMATSQDFATWTCGPHLRPRFLLLCLRAMRQDLLGRLAMGSTHQTIYMPDIEAIRIPLPPVDEQDLIVDEVWERLRAADEAADLLSHQIDLLLERRNALVTSAVTGELDLAEAA